VYRSYVSQPSFPQATTPTGETQAKQTSSLSETSNPKSSKTPASDKPNAKQHTTLAETSDPLATAPKSGKTQKKHYSTLSETSDSPTTAPQSSEPQSDDKPHATQHSTLAETSDPLATAPLSSEPQATQPTPLAETSDPSATAPNASEAHPTRLAPLYTRSDSSSQAEPPVTPPEASATPSSGKRPAPGTKPGPLKTKPGEPRAFIKGTLDKSGPTPHLLTLADLSPHQIQKILKMSLAMKHSFQLSPLKIRQSLTGRTIALMFNKRSTRTRVASETSANALGGSAMFLGSSDVQLGVNETLEDTAKTVGGMADGIMARVGEHDDVEVRECAYIPDDHTEGA